MRSGKRVVAIAGVAGLSVLLGAGVAMAAASGTFSLSVSGASASGSYRYDVKPSGTYPGTGIYYSGTLRNTGTTDTHYAYFYARVEGYGWTQLAKAASRSNASINRVVYDPQALYVRHSQAQVCRDRTFLGQVCSVGTYNY
ncbi:hypothetical protein ACWEOW_07190 [Monashia sp. NPDC004114]